MGNIDTTPEEKVRARVAKYARRAQGPLLSKKQKLKKKRKGAISVRAISGGLPSLGKRR
jgi:hypothetical protein